MAQGLWALTKMEKDTFGFVWIVKEFSDFSSCDEIKSPGFKGPKYKYLWQLTMKPRVKVDGVEHVDLRLAQTEVIPSAEKLTARFELSLCNLKGKVETYLGGPASPSLDFSSPANDWGSRKFIPYAELTAPKFRWLEDNTLRIHCSIWIDGEVQHEVGSGPNPHSTHHHQHASLRANKDKALEDFGRFITEGGELYADVAIITDTKTFMAHKAFLSARSKVFSAMFIASMAEKETGTVEIKDFDEETVKGMLEYVYTGQVVNLRDDARSLLQIAEKYDLQGLKVVAEVSIVNDLSVDNAAETLILAHLVNATDLKTKAIEFINRNKGEVKKTEDFQRLVKSNAGVLAELHLASE